MANSGGVRRPSTSSAVIVLLLAALLLVRGDMNGVLGASSSGASRSLLGSASCSDREYSDEKGDCSTGRTIAVLEFCEDGFDSGCVDECRAACDAHPECDAFEYSDSPQCKLIKGCTTVNRDSSDFAYVSLCKENCPESGGFYYAVNGYEYRACTGGDPLLAAAVDKNDDPIEACASICSDHGGCETFELGESLEWCRLFSSDDDCDEKYVDNDSDNTIGHLRSVGGDCDDDDDSDSDSDSDASSQQSEKESSAHQAVVISSSSGTGDGSCAREYAFVGDKGCGCTYCTDYMLEDLWCGPSGSAGCHETCSTACDKNPACDSFRIKDGMCKLSQGCSSFVSNSNGDAGYDPNSKFYTCLENCPSTSSPIVSSISSHWQCDSSCMIKWVELDCGSSEDDCSREAECGQACMDTDGCGHFLWDYDDGYCFLYESDCQCSMAEFATERYGKGTVRKSFCETGAPQYLQPFDGLGQGAAQWSTPSQICPGMGSHPWVWETPDGIHKETVGYGCKAIGTYDKKLEPDKSFITYTDGSTWDYEGSLYQCMKILTRAVDGYLIDVSSSDIGHATYNSENNNCYLYLATPCAYLEFNGVDQSFWYCEQE